MDELRRLAVKRILELARPSILAVVLLLTRVRVRVAVKVGVGVRV